MSRYFNRFDHTDTAKYNAFVDQADAAVTYAVGELGSEGILSLVSGFGNNLFTKSYSLSENTVKFHRAVEANNGDFVIFGSKESEGVLQAIMVRVTDSGTISWSASYDQGGIDRCVDMVKAGEDDFFFLVEMRPEMNTFEIVKVDGSDGSVLADFQAVPEEFNYFPEGLETHDTSILTYGSTDMNGARESYFIDLNNSLLAQSSETVSDNRYQVPKDVLYKGSGKFVVVGDYDDSRISMIYEYRSGGSTVSAETMDICESVNDEGVKRIKKLSDSPEEYLLLAQNDPRSDAYLCEFNASFAIQSRYRVSQLADFQLNDLQVFPTNSEPIRAVGGYNAAMDDGLALRTNDQFELCCIANISTPTDTTKTYTVSTFTLEDTSPRRRDSGLTLVTADQTFSKEEECPSTQIDLTGTHMFQSPYLYLQAAGSDASDDTVKGFHLRWHLKGVLGNKHFPKGNLSGPYGAYAATYGFNKSEDFTQLYRTPFVNNYYTNVDLTTQPNTYNVGGTVREWRYTNLNPAGVSSPTSADVVVSFPDTQAYDIQAASTPPTSSTDNFLKNYSGEIHVRLDGKLSFRIQWSFGYVNSGNLTDALFRHEMVSLENSEDSNSQKVKKRDTLDTGDFPGTHTTICEDIYMARYDRVNAYPTSIRFYAYADYIQGVNQANAWTKISENALTTDQTEAFTRLENAPSIEINNKWPKFNDDNSTTGKFKVKVANYEDRWTRTNGISAGVDKYLTLSQTSTNEKAEESVAPAPEGTLQNDHQQTISYFNLLGIASIDYHIARMLGFGEIDPMSSAGTSEEFIYLAEYDTEGDLEDGQGARDMKHLYMTPDQTILDYKNPPVPELQDPITYGMAFNNGTGSPYEVTNAEGYTPFADIRFVNLNRQPFAFEQPFDSFFSQSTHFDSTFAADSVGYGVEYKEQSGTFVEPELNHDQYYKDNADVFETNLIPNTGNNPVYRHQETNEGVHCYRMYSVNWFSRPSGLSAQVCTDETIFPARNTIAPPANVSALLIQTESPALLSTPDEQTVYGGMSNDRTYVRTIFDWNYIQNQQYQFADRAELFFHKQEKLITKGEITAINALSNNRLELITGAYDITSASPVETVTPTIADTLTDSFKDSLIAIDGLNYRVESVVTTNAGTGENPKIIIHKIRETNSVETVTGSNTWTTTENYVEPSVGDRFFITENLTVGKNWDNKLQKSVFLETFSTNDTLKVVNSTDNDGNYSIDSVAFSSPNTVINVKEDVIDTVNDGSIEVQLRFASKGFKSGNDGYLIDGDVASYFTLTSNVKIKGAILNDGNYTTGVVTFNGTDTVVPINESLDTTSSVGYLYLTVQLSVVDYDTANKTISIANDYSGLIVPTYKENRLNEDGTETLLTVGGVVANASVVEDLDIYTDLDEAAGHGTAGTSITNSKTGIYTITFTGNPLPDHIDPDVSWFRGKIRILEDATELPSQVTGDTRTTPRMKELDVSYFEVVINNLIIYASDPTFAVSRDLSQMSTAYDPINDYVPIETGTVSVNYHPSYRLYLTVDENTVDGVVNAFNETSMLPALNEGSRRTLLGLRAIDSEKNNPVTDNLASRLSTPAALNAMEIRDPMPPNKPDGLDYATRPDFYGKSSYTMDVAFPLVTEPYSVMLYRANGRKILETLYSKATMEDIILELGEIFTDDPDFSTRWQELVEVVTDVTPPTGVWEFNEFNGYRLPNPDNPNYVIPVTATDPSPIYPFDGTTPPGSTTAMFNGVPMVEVVKEAIRTAFVPITAEPMLYQALEQVTGNFAQTSPEPPKLRDDNGRRLTLGDAEFNPHPNALRLSNGDVRFTDYNIDGGAVDFYFYYGVEMSDKLIASGPSPMLGPVQVINTRPAKKPNIKKVTTTQENAATGVETAVCFELERYVESEGIVQVDIYRALDPLDALTTRSMTKAKSIDVSAGMSSADICDDFDGLAYPLYGEQLYYRLVALREITLEDGVTTELIPSEASDMVQATVADPINPEAACITSENGTTTATELQNVILKWDQQCYNGTYSLQKMNDAGNWVEIYSVKSNDATMQYPPLDGNSQPDFTNFDETAALSREDANGTSIYHRFRVQVENSSGLFNLSDCPRVLATGDFDLQVLPTYLSYEDDNGVTLSEIATQEIDNGLDDNPTGMRFTANVPSVLPAGHNSFTEIEITVEDDQGNNITKSINTINGFVDFFDGDNGLLLDESNHTYTITTALKTDLATNGFKTKAILSYVHGPCNDLSNIAQILTVTDNSHTFDIDAPSLNVNDSNADAPITLQFTDVSDVANLTIPQTFTSLDITVTDDLGNSETKQITTAGGSVTFDNTGTLVIDDGDSNRGYAVQATLKTTQCTAGEQFSYNIQYTFDPYTQLGELSDVVSFEDDNTANISPLVSQNVDNDVSHPGGKIKITDLLGPNLPSNHTFDEVEVTLFDGNGGTHTLTIGTSGGFVEFLTGQGPTGGELDLGVTNPNPTISLEVRMKTDLCPDGAVFYYNMPYTYDPYVFLATQTNIANFSDGNTPYNVSPLYVLDVNDKPLEFTDAFGETPGTFKDPNGSITIQDASAGYLPAGDTFTSMEVTLSDGIGGESTKTINAANGSVTFTQADGVEVDGGSAVINTVTEPFGGENRTYTMVIELKTSLCPVGVTFVYSGRYTWGL